MTRIEKLLLFMCLVYDGRSQPTLLFRNNEQGKQKK